MLLLQKKRNKAKTIPSGSGEQESLPSLSTAPAQTAELSDACLVAQKIQTPGSEVAKPGADLLAGDNRGAHENGGALGHLGKEAQSLEMVAEGSHSSVAAMTPSKESTVNNVAAPSPGSTALKEVRGGSTTQSGEVVRSNTEESSGVSDTAQLLESGPDSQSLGSRNKLTSTGGRTNASSGFSSSSGVSESELATSCAERGSQDTKTPPLVKSLEAGKGRQDTSQEVSCLATKVSV